MSVRFVKVEGAGNDLILIDDRGDAAEVAVQMCDRLTGVGADGLLTVAHREGAPPFVRMFNPDGTEDFCGNGLRCVAAWLRDSGRASDDPVVLETPRGRHEARVSAVNARSFEVDVDIVEPDFRPAAIPVDLPGERVLEHPLEVAGRTWPVSCVSTGTAHTVIFIDADVPDAVFREVSPLIEHHAIFPERTTVLWCRAESAERIRMRIWERGVGETCACGTGACAAVVIGGTLGRTAGRAEVVTSGGRMAAEWGRGPVRLIGPARIIYEGDWNPQ